MSTFHLRPVAEHSPSPSSSVSTTTAGDHSPPPPPPPPRRPLSPSSLRGESHHRHTLPSHPHRPPDINLTQDANPVPRKYPAPPTGHELMALFPPASPANFPEMRPGPTSGFFQRQERAFFAQAGKEIVRVRVEIDVPPAPPSHPPSSSTAPSGPPSASSDESLPAGKPRDQPPAPGSAPPPRTWPQLPPHPQHHSPVDPSSAPPYPPLGSSKSSRPPRGVVVAPVPSATTMFPVSPHGQLPQPPLNLHPPPSHHTALGLRTPPHDSHPGAPPPAKVEFQPPEEYREDPDDAWRRPTPYADRRRAGKHTRRVIVRN